MLAASNCRKEVAAWQQKRNAAVVKVHWQFATAVARISQTEEALTDDSTAMNH